MHAYFSTLGTITEINLMFKKKETGFCYVTFENEDDAMNLINQKIIYYNGYQLEVKRAIPKDLKESEEDQKSKVPSTQQHSYA